MKTSPVILLVLFVCISACNFSSLEFDNLKKPVLTSDAALPIGHASYSIRELIEDVGDSLVDIQEDSITSVLTLYYFDTVEFINNTKLVEINDISYSASILLPNTPPLGSQQVISVDTVLSFSYPAKNKEILESVYYKSGNLHLDILSSLGSDILYGIGMDNTRDVVSDNPAFFSGRLSGGANRSNNYDLVGHKTSLITQGDSNIFHVTVSISVFIPAGDSLTTDDHIDLNIAFEDQLFDLIYGKVGQDTLQFESQNMKIDFFSAMGASGLKFKSPEFELSFDNSFGIPIGVFLGDVYGLDSTDNIATKTYLSGNVTNTPQVIAPATTPSESASSSITLNSTNSSIQDLLATTPKNIVFDLMGITNPVDTTVSNFYMDTSKIRTALKMVLPLELSMRNVSRELSFSLGSGLNFDGAETLTARIVSSNGLPFSIRMGLDIRDESGNVLHMVPNQIVMEIPFIDTDGFVVQPRKYITDMALGADGVNALQVGSELVVTLYVNTPGNNSTRDNFVKILADYQVDVQVSLAGKLKAEL